MSTVEIPEKFTVGVCYVIYWHLLRLHSRLHPCIHDASGQRHAAEQIAADRLSVFQLKGTDRIGGPWLWHAMLD